MRHPNVVGLRDVMFFGEKKKLYMVFDFHQYDLKRHMDVVGPIPTETVKSMLQQLVTGIGFCHARRILHRDLKPQNLLVDWTDGNVIVKLADFGLARAVQRPVRKYTKEVVTLWYRPPEILLGLTHYSAPVDIWAVGCIFAEMARAEHSPLFPGDSEIDQIFRIFRTRGTPTEDDWSGVSQLPDFNLGFPQWKKRPLEEIVPTLDANGLDLLERLLTYDPKRRMTAKSVLQHPYFHTPSISIPSPNKRKRESDGTVTEE